MLCPFVEIEYFRPSESVFQTAFPIAILSAVQYRKPVFAGIFDIVLRIKTHCL